MNLDVAHLKSWIGKSETTHDVVSTAPVRMLRATLDLPETDINESTALPPLWHWLYFLPSAQQNQLGADGHAKRGGFLPTVPLPRRMWAGGQLEFFAPIFVGQHIRRVSTIEEVSVKQGGSGTLCFVRVKHEVFTAQNTARGEISRISKFAAGNFASPSNSTPTLALREFHDIVYRDLPAAPTKPAAYQVAPASNYSETIIPSDPLLFRYSALTFNGHRIHYDRKYVTEVEGYPGLIVHGPLMATLLAGLGCKLHATSTSPLLHTVRAFEFRALKPVFDLQPFQICAGELNSQQALWVRDAAGDLAMQATLKFAS